MSAINDDNQRIDIAGILTRIASTLAIERTQGADPKTIWITLVLAVVSEVARELNVDREKLLAEATRVWVEANPPVGKIPAYPDDYEDDPNPPTG